MKQILTAISLVISLFVTGQAQSDFVVAGNSGFSVGQIFAIPAVSADGVSSSPGVQQAYVVIVDYADVRHEGEPYSGYDFYVPADFPDVDTVLTHYDPYVRDYYGYDSITNLALDIILIDCSIFAPAVDGSGNEYEVVKLIHDCWLKSNLRTQLYADGTEVPDVRQYPGTDLETYGYLYTYDAATGHYVARGDTLQGACPEGWHIPTYEKVVELMSHYEAADLMATTNWINPGNNSSGFTMQPGGFYNPAGHVPYERLYVSAHIWSFTPGSSIHYALEFGSVCGTMELVPVSGDPGYSVRCLKDKPLY